MSSLLSNKPIVRLTLIALISLFICSLILLKRQIAKNDELKSKIADIQLINSQQDQMITISLRLFLSKIDEKGLVDFSMEESFIENINSGIRLVLYYPKSFCSICDKNLFKIFKEYPESELVKSLIVIVPLENYREFIIFNATEELGFSTILAHDKDLLKLPEEITKGIILLLNSNGCKPSVSCIFG